MMIFFFTMGGVYDGKDVELPFEWPRSLSPKRRRDWYYTYFSGITLLDDHDGNGI